MFKGMKLKSGAEKRVDPRDRSAERRRRRDVKKHGDERGDSGKRLREEL